MRRMPFDPTKCTTVCGEVQLTASQIYGARFRRLPLPSPAPLSVILVQARLYIYVRCAIAVTLVRVARLAVSDSLSTRALPPPAKLRPVRMQSQCAMAIDTTAYIRRLIDPLASGTVVCTKAVRAAAGLV